MKPAIAPLALDYLAGALARAGYEAAVVDLNLAADPHQALEDFFAARTAVAVGLTFRNSDDCFWPSGASFVPRLREIVAEVKGLTDAPVVLGGNGFSLFPAPILKACDCSFGIEGDGEEALVQLVRAFERGSGLEDVPGLVRRIGGREEYRCNPPHRPAPLSLSTTRDVVDNRRYFEEGGQMGVETKRGCPNRCTYCADPLSKGSRVRTRSPKEVGDEVESLLRQGIDVLHLCDSEFNIPPDHALAVCRELIRRGLGDRVRWYTYASIIPFADELARAMREAGCIGINFGADSANAQMLSAYGRSHRKPDIAAAVRLCRQHGIRVMLDLLLGGPGETEATVGETIAFMKEIGPDCVGSALGVRVYPGTALARQVMAEGALSRNPNLRRAGASASEHDHTADATAALLQPTFYISEALGENPAGLVKEIIAGDQRFFEPTEEQGMPENYNYNQNLLLIEAIKNGARGAYWDILQQMRNSAS